MKRICILIICLLSISGQFIVAQDTENETSISVQLRPRAEYRNGALMPRYEGERAASFINNRARFSLNYKRDFMTIQMSAQHVGVWGQDPQIDKNGRFILNEAWAQLDLNDYFFAKIGRQSLVYDDERILGGLDWNVAGRFHDALKLGYEDSANKLHLILSFNQNDEHIKGGTYYADGAQPYKSMQTLWYQYKLLGKPFSFSALVMNLGQEGGTPEEADTQYMQTFGANIGYSPETWKVTGSFYYQSGKNKADISVSAWMASIQAGYKFDDTWNINIGSDYLSGNKEDSDKYKAFNPLYGTHHKFYGAMDYFYASNFLSGMNPGLWDNYAGIGYKASKNLNLALNYHYFTMTADVTSDREKLSKGLGSEFDFQLDWNIMKDVKLSGGYSFMLGTKSMDVVKGGDHKSWQDWGWVSLNINPRILFLKW